MATTGFEKHARVTRKAEFLAEMERLMPWEEICALIEPHYPKVGNGRPPIGLERMLRMCCLANWFNLADGSTLGLFRKLLETHNLGAAIFAKVGELLMQNGLRLSGGTIVDAR